MREWAGWRALRALALKEFYDRMRSRWVLIATVGFAVFATAIPYLGSAPVGVVGFREFEVAVVSLASLTTYFIPLLALLLAGGVIVEEQERGTLDLLITAPLSRWELLAGKYLGLSLSLAVATLLGFALAGAAMALRVGPAGAGLYGLFVGQALLLGLAFISLAFLLSVLFRERSRLVAACVVVWLALALLYDLALLGLLAATKGGIGSGLLTVLLLGNPVDVFRLLSFAALGEEKVLLLLAAVEMPVGMGYGFLLGVLVLWVLGPLALAGALFGRYRHEG